LPNFLWHKKCLKIDQGDEKDHLLRKRKGQRFMTKTIIACLLVIGMLSSIGNALTVPEEARRHMVRGQTALEMAESSGEYEQAIKEFQEAARLAPTWPAPYYNLGLVQEKTGKLREAVASLNRYLQLAPNAPDADTVRTLVYKLEFKAENEIPDSEALDIFASLSDVGKWKRTGEGSGRGTALRYRRIGDQIEIETFSPVRGAPEKAERRFFAEVTGRTLKYHSFYLEDVKDVQLEIVSRTKIRGREEEYRGTPPFVKRDSRTESQKGQTFIFEYVLKERK
jgi:tetratricopeptide (TPR) repeat protein